MSQAPWRQATLPDHVSPALMAAYQYERRESRQNTQESDKRFLHQPGAVAALLVGVVTYSVCRWSLELSTVFQWITTISMVVLTIVVGALLIARDPAVLSRCPKCKEDLTPDSPEPESSWLCVNCDFDHFQHWRKTRIGPDPRAQGLKGKKGEKAEAYARANLAKEYNAHKKWFLAHSLLEEAIGLHADEPHFWNELGFSQVCLGKNREALRSCDTAISLDPDEAKFHNSRGRVLFELGRLDEAMSSVDKALRIDPSYAQARRAKMVLQSAMSPKRRY